MPTINLNNQNPTPPQPAPVQNNNGGWNDPWGDGFGGTDQNKGQKRLSPQERVTMIEKVYQLVLGRNPDTRDINYYKYSTLGEEEIKEQLLAGKEHKQLLEDGREYKKTKDRAMQAETRVKMLEGQIRDQIEEFKGLTNLLREKNQHISQLRERINTTFNTNPFNNRPAVSQPQAQFVQPEQKQEDRKQTFVDRLKGAVKSFV